MHSDVLRADESMLVHTVANVSARLLRPCASAYLCLRVDRLTSLSLSGGNANNAKNTQNKRSVDLVRQRDLWKDGLREMRKVVEDLQKQGFRNETIWCTFIDKQVTNHTSAIHERQRSVI